MFARLPPKFSLFQPTCIPYETENFGKFWEGTWPAVFCLSKLTFFCADPSNQLYFPAHGQLSGEVRF